MEGLANDGVSQEEPVEVGVQLLAVRSELRGHLCRHGHVVVACEEVHSTVGVQAKEKASLGRHRGDHRMIHHEVQHLGRLQRQEELEGIIQTARRRP